MEKLNSFVFEDDFFEEEKQVVTEVTDEVIDEIKGTEVTETTEVVDNDDNPFQILTNMLVENSVVDTELLTTKEYSDDAEGILELINDTVSKKYESFVEEKFSDERYKTVLGILDNGGDLSQIAAIYDEVDYAAVDVTDEDNQELLVRDFYSRNNLNDKKIDALIKTAKDEGSWEEEVNQAHNALIKMQTEQALALKEELENANKKAQEDAVKELEKFKTLVFSKEEIAGFKLDAKEKQKFFEYSTKVVKDGKTQMELDYEDTEKQLQMSFMSYINFNKKDVENKIKTEVNSKLAKSITSLKDKTAKTGSSSTEESPLEGVLFFNP